MQTDYPSSLISVFASIARTPRTYVYHKDIPSDKWNIYKMVDGREEFEKQVETLEEAQTFCDNNNGR